MKTILNLTNSHHHKIKFIDENRAAKEIRNIEKKWSFSNVYFFTEFRDVYIALTNFTYETYPKNFIKDFTQFCLSIKLPFVKTPWEERRIQEYLNSYKNFSIVAQNYKPSRKVFIRSRIGGDLSPEDINDLKTIYFDYFRFKELFSWLIKPATHPDINSITKITPEIIYKESQPIFFFSRNSGKKDRFTDTFIYELKENTNIYYLSGDQGQVARFWDVFTSWGKTLKILEKFRLNFPPIRTSLNPRKGLGCCYVVNEIFPALELLSYLNEHYKSRHIYLPYLSLDIALRYRVRLESVHNFILEEYNKNFGSSFKA